MINRLRAQDFTFILIRPKYPANIGSAARALKNMGFSKLSLVCPSVPPTDPEAIRLAVGAADLLKKAKVFETIGEASRGMNFLVGTSCRTGKYRGDFVPLPQLAENLPIGQKIGILFGTEDRGLTNRELAHCNLVTTIPTNPKFSSLNLAQAVMAAGYQLRIAGSLNQSSSLPLPHFAPVHQIEAMYQHLEKMLDRIGFFPHKNSFHMIRTIRRIFGRTGLTGREVRIIRGICRQVLWATAKNKPGLLSDHHASCGT